MRTANEDAFVCAPADGVFAVIDGMGGAQAGDVAADITRAAVLEEARATGDPRTAVQRAHEHVCAHAERHPTRRGMGCVATVVTVEGPHLELAHVGDTRAYLASRGACEQLTRDHTVVADLQEQHGMTETDAGRLPGRHRVTRNIGDQDRTGNSWIDVGSTPFEPGDLLLLCSDGLSDLVPDDELFRLLEDACGAPQFDAAALTDRLIELALERGAPDNVTVVAVQRLGDADEPPPMADTTAHPWVAVSDLRRSIARRAGAATALLAAFALGWLGHQSLTGLTQRAAALREATDGRLRPFAAGLDHRFDRDTALVAARPMTITTQTVRTEVAAGVSLTLSGAALRFPDQPAAWTLDLGPNSRIYLQQVSIRAPELLLNVRLAVNSRLILIDSHLDVAGLDASGPSDARIEVNGGRLHLRARGPTSLDGPRLVGAVSPLPGYADVVSTSDPVEADPR